MKAAASICAVTSSTEANDERWGYRRQLFDLLETHILPRFDEDI